MQQQPIDIANVLLVINLTTLVGVIWWVAKLSFGFGQMQLKVDTVWDFLVKRAKVEFVQAGLGTMNSPVNLFPESFEKAISIVDKILPVYVKILHDNPGISEKEMFIQFEVNFGDLMVETLCIPNGISLGACIVWFMKACQVRHDQHKNGEDHHEGSVA